MADINIQEVANKVIKAVKGNPALLESLTSDPKGLIEKVANIKNLSSGDVSSIVGLVTGGSKDGGLLGGALGGGEGGGLDIGGIAGGLLGGKKKE